MTLNEVMKDTADAIREKTGTSDLIAPVNFATEIKGISAGGSGSSELEGEYFLAKPNGRYWKSKLSTMTENIYAEFPQIGPYGIKAEDMESFLMSQAVFSTLSYTSIIGGREGPIDHGYEIYADYQLRVAELYGRCDCGYGLIGELRSSWCSVAWEEADVLSSMFHELGYDDYVDVVAFMRVMMEGEADDMTDDEILALFEDMFMVEQVTKEEYESWHNWN